MNVANRIRLASVALAAAVLLSSPLAWAQEISESHLKAARSAVSAIRATEQFDQILPAAAGAIKTQLIQKNPDLQEIISKTVDEKTLALASRRVDLEKEAALSYARVFSEQELNDIATFYNSPTGKKLISDGPIALREVLKAAEIWQRGIARDLAQAVDEALQPVMPKPATPPGAEAAGKPSDAAAKPAEDPASGSN